MNNQQAYLPVQSQTSSFGEVLQLILVFPFLLMMMAMMKDVIKISQPGGPSLGEVLKGRVSGVSKKVSGIADLVAMAPGKVGAIASAVSVAGAKITDLTDQTKKASINETERAELLAELDELREKVAVYETNL